MQVIIRSFYMAVAKSVHTPARRQRDEQAAAPSLGARAASLGLATALRGALTLTLPKHIPPGVLEAGAATGVSAAVAAYNVALPSVAAGASASSAGAPPPAVSGIAAEVVAAGSQLTLLQASGHIARLAESLNLVSVTQCVI